MRIANEKLKDPVYLTGLVLVAGSFLFYMVPVIYPSSVSTASGGLFLAALEKEINKLLILKPFGQILADK